VRGHREATHIVSQPLFKSPTCCTLIHNFGFAGVLHDVQAMLLRAQELLHEAMRILVSQACQIYWRFEIKYESYPYKLLTMVHDRYDKVAKERVRKNMFKLPLCCLDGDHFTKRLRDVYTKDESMLDDLRFVEDLLSQWGKRGRITNMHVERLQSVPQWGPGKQKGVTPFDPLPFLSLSLSPSPEPSISSFSPSLLPSQTPPTKITPPSPLTSYEVLSSFTFVIMCPKPDVLNPSLC
jgi:hypothetical protein